jgi:hypothetical protein
MPLELLTKVPDTTVVLGTVIVSYVTLVPPELPVPLLPPDERSEFHGCSPDNTGAVAKAILTATISNNATVNLLLSINLSSYSLALQPEPILHTM